MSQENVKPDQIQASVAAALSRLRGDLSPPSDAPADAPSAAAAQAQPPRPEPAQPANDLRAEPGFKPMAAGIAPKAPTEGQSPAEPELPRAMFSRPRFMTSSTPDSTPAVPAAPTVQRTSGPLARMMNKEAPQAASEQPVTAAPASEPAPAQAATPGQEQQPDLLAGLPPPPIGDALTVDHEAAAQRRRRNRRVLALSVALVAVVAGFWFWGMGRGGSKDVPVITADSTPEKVKPIDEGGLQVPNQNVQVLDNMDSSQAAAEGETVLPPPEQPVTPPAPAIEESQPAPEAEATDNATATLQDVPSVTAPPVVEAPEPAAEAGATEIPPAPAAEPATAATPEAPAAAAEPAPEPASAPEATAEPESTQPIQAQPEPSQPEAAAAPTQEANVAPTPAPAGDGPRIQLAAVKSEAAAKAEWAKLQKAHPELLGGLTLTVEKVDKGASGIFYRVQAGPLADRAAAKQLCADLKARNQDCLVAK